MHGIIKLFVDLNIMSLIRFIIRVVFVSMRFFCAGGKSKRSVEKVTEKKKKTEKVAAKRQYIQRGYRGQLAS